MTSSVPDAHRSSSPSVIDFAVIGSGFGGSVAALRLAEKGHRVVVLERGRRFEDRDFPRTNWNLRRYLWAPALRCFGILEISPFRDVFVLHGAGVGGGSLGYAGVLTAPDEVTLASAEWSRLEDWRTRLRPHFATARRMLGVEVNPRLWPADLALREIAVSMGRGDAFSATPVGVHFGPEGEEGATVPDPYFGGEGPERVNCLHCGACMIGCRYNAKNTLPKNYLWFAERRGVCIEAETTATDIRSLGDSEPDGARFELHLRSTRGILRTRRRVLRARNVVVAAGALGTVRLLLRCREETRSLPALSGRLGHDVRTNHESILGVAARGTSVDFSRGVAITSIVQADRVTSIEPVRYPAGSSLLRFLAAPTRLAGDRRGLAGRLLDVLRMYVLPGWSSRTTIILAMQGVEERLRLRRGRSAFTFFRRGLVSEAEGSPSPAHSEIGHRVMQEFARRVDGIPASSANERFLGIPLTAHILGGCPMGRDASEGVVDTRGRVHGYPGLYVCDGSIMPANPGVNPSLTITALAEWVMEGIPGAGTLPTRNPVPGPAPAPSG